MKISAHRSKDEYNLDAITLIYYRCWIKCWSDFTATVDCCASPITQGVNHMYARVLLWIALFLYLSEAKAIFLFCCSICPPSLRKGMLQPPSSSSSPLDNKTINDMTSSTTRALHCMFYLFHPPLPLPKLRVARRVYLSLYMWRTQVKMIVSVLFNG